MCCIQCIQSEQRMRMCNGVRDDVVLELEGIALDLMINVE